MVSPLCLRAFVVDLHPLRVLPAFAVTIPAMNKTERMLAIVLELQRGGGRRAEDLAATFETSVRTIYRDVQALSEAGVPLVATPGQGYRLLDGYFLPPVAFTVDEATTLLLGGDVVARQFDAPYRAAAESALRKLDAALPAGLRGAVAERRERLRFLGPLSPEPDVAERLGLLRRAVLEGIGVRFRYYGWRSDREGGAPTERDVDPHTLDALGGVWYLVGHDHLRGAIRRFRLERMEAIALMPRTFALSPADAPCEEEHRPLTVRALFAPAVARHVREFPTLFAVAHEHTADGLLVTLRVREAAQVLPWLLSWGGGVRVVEPESVRALLAAEAAAMLTHYS